jgi:hypothetical protein
MGKKLDNKGAIMNFAYKAGHVREALKLHNEEISEGIM